jgi:hypothetical protein
MSNLTDLLPAGAGGKQVSFVASGTIGNGVTVALNSNGTVTAVVETAASSGTPTVFESGSTNNVGATFDSSNNKVVIAYRDSGNSNYGTAVVGTVSGSSISFGTPVVFSSADSDYNAATFDSTNNKIVIAYRRATGANPGKAVVGTVSGTSISFGTEGQFNSGDSRSIAITYDSSSGKVVIAFEDFDSFRYGSAIVGTVSGTSISFGSKTNFETESTDNIGIAYDSSATKVVIAYRDNANSEYGTARVGTVSGTSISFSSPAVVFISAVAKKNAVAYDPVNAKIVIAFHNETNSDYGTAIVGTVSGTSISFGSSVVFESAATYNLSVTFDSSASKVVIAYSDGGNSNYGTAITGTVSGTSISFESPTVFENASTANYFTAFDSSANKTVISYTDGGNSNRGTSVTYSPASTNNTDFIGISDAAISDTASGSVTIKGGISTNVTGLTANALYYVKKSGGLTPTTTYATSGYNLDGATYTSTYNVSAQSVADEVRFNPSGTKMFVLGYDQVFQYSLSTAFDTATASYDSVVFSVSSQDTQAIGLAFNNDGTKMYMSGNQTDSVYQYSLSVGFDMSTASYDSVSLSVTAQETSPESLAFNDDGTKMYIVGQNSDTVFQYSLSSAFDLSTASYDSISLSVSGQESGPTGIAFSGDGTKMFIVGYPTDTVYQYGLTSAWDLSTASYSSISFSVSSQDSAPKGVTFSTDGTIMYIAGSASSGTIHQYSTAVTDTTTVLAGKALSSTSINLDYTT